MDAKFYAELVAMVEDAEAGLAQFETTKDGQTPSKHLHDIFIVCLDGDKLDATIRAQLPLRQINAFQSAVFGFKGPLSFHKGPGKNPHIQNALGVIKREAKAIEAKLTDEETAAPKEHSRGGYVHASRIAELQALKTPRLDPKRLVRLLEELNAADAADCHMATAMLVRAVVDHVPPVFNHEKFVQVVANYSGGKSFKKSVEHLQESLRHIADAHLHLPMRQTEVVPTPNQVDFRADLDVLLGEVLRLLRSP